MVKLFYSAVNCELSSSFFFFLSFLLYVIVIVCNLNLTLPGFHTESLSTISGFPDLPTEIYVCIEFV